MAILAVRGICRLRYGQRGPEDYEGPEPPVPWTPEREARIQAIIQRIWSDPEWLEEWATLPEARSRRKSRPARKEARKTG